MTICRQFASSLQLPLVKLDDGHYKLVDQLEALIAPGEDRIV
jgi:hypothetical protein